MWALRSNPSFWVTGKYLQKEGGGHTVIGRKGGNVESFRKEREAMYGSFGRRGHVYKLREDMGESSCVSSYLVSGL